MIKIYRQITPTSESKATHVSLIPLSITPWGVRAGTRPGDLRQSPWGPDRGGSSGDAADTECRASGDVTDIEGGAEVDAANTEGRAAGESIVSGVAPWGKLQILRAAPKGVQQALKA